MTVRTTGIVESNGRVLNVASPTVDVTTLSDDDLALNLAACKLILDQIGAFQKALKAEAIDNREFEQCDVPELGIKVNLKEAYESSFDIEKIGQEFFKANRLEDFWKIVSLVQDKVKKSLTPDDALVKVIESNKETIKKPAKEVKVTAFSKADNEKHGIVKG